MSVSKEIIRTRLADYVNRITKPSPNAGENMYKCPLCGSGTHRGRNSDGAFHVDGEVWYCHACQAGGDIFSLYGEIHHLDSETDFRKIADGLVEELGLTEGQEIHGMEKPSGNSTLQEKQQETQRKEQKMQINEYVKKMAGSPGEQYLHDRGLSDEIIREFRLGYDTGRNAVVIPYPGTDYYTKRFISPQEGRCKYDNLPGEAPTFMVQADSDRIFYITEGQIDAISIVQMGGGNVIASHYPTKIREVLKKIHILGAVIIADRDEAGEKLAGGMLECFKQSDVKAVVITPPEPYKDANDMLKACPEKLEELLSDGKAQCLKLILQGDDAFRDLVVSDYVNNGFEEDISYFQQYRNRKTGFPNVDEHLTLYPGLACLTGATSLGKTSFCMQLADQLTDQGETVLYFSLEQLAVELVTKSLTRLAYIKDADNAVCNTKIKNGEKSETLEKIKTEYIQRADKLHIVECDFTVTADKIIRHVERFIEVTGTRPIVIIDYLQILSGPEGQICDERKKIDDAVKNFKLMARRNELFVLMISNMARTSYREPIGEDSYKESGLIEYTCDYLLGLQLTVLEDDSFYTKNGTRGGQKETLKSEKQKAIDEASKAIPKKVVLKACKNRNGVKVFRAFFHYYPQYDYFEPCKAPDGKMSITERQQNFWISK